jgi:putative ABC transport system permease protein
MRRLDPVWRKAPFLLRRFPQILAAVVAGAMILGATAAARPGYLASSGRAAIGREIEELSRWAGGLRVLRAGFLGRPFRAVEGAGEEPGEFRLRPVPFDESVDFVQQEIARLVAPLGNLQAPVVFMAGGPLRVAGEEGSDAQARLGYRDEWRRHVTVVAEGGPADGVWLSDTTARQIDVAPAETVVLSTGGREARVTVAGIYRHLVAEPPREAWGPVSELVYKEPNADTYPPPLVLAERDVFAGLARSLDDAGTIEWFAPLAPGEIALPEAARTARDIERLISEHLSDFGTPVTRALGPRGFQPSDRYRSSEFGGIVREAHRRVAALRGPVDVVSLASSCVAAAVLIAAGYYLVQRRRTEFASLVIRGVSPTALAARAVVELALPTLLGGCAGAVLGLSIAGALGPARGFPAEAARAAGLAAIFAVAAGLVLAGAAVLAAARAQETVSPARRRSALPVWEVALAAVAAAVVFRLATVRGSVGGADAELRLDLLLLPLVAVGATGALGARILQRALAVMREPVRRAPPPVYLAVRRLANSSGTAIALVAACAFSIGVFAYATALEASTERSARRKAYLFAAADAAALVAPGADAGLLDVPATSVVRFDRFTFPGAADSAEVIGIDPSTFAAAAYWDPALADEPLDSLLRALDRPDGGSIPVLSVAGADVGSAGDAVEVVGRARAFPGQIGRDPVLVAPTDALLDALSRGRATSAGRADEIWMRAGPEGAAAALARAEVPYYGLRTAAAVLRAPSLQSLSWALALLRALGLGAAVLSVAGLLLYLQARERATVVTLALARRMRFSARNHLVMLSIENLTLLGIGLSVGLGAGIAAVRFLLPRFDLLPTLLPAPVMVVPFLPVALVAAATIALALAGAVWARASAARRDIVEVLRS